MSQFNHTLERKINHCSEYTEDKDVAVKVALEEILNKEINYTSYAMQMCVTSLINEDRERFKRFYLAACMNAIPEKSKEICEVITEITKRSRPHDFDYWLRF